MTNVTYTACDLLPNLESRKSFFDSSGCFFMDNLLTRWFPWPMLSSLEETILYWSHDSRFWDYFMSWTFSFLYWPTFYHSRHDMWTWHCCYNLSTIIKAKLNSPDIPYVWYRPSRTDNPNESYQCQYIEGIWVVDRYGNGQQLPYQNGKQLM